MIWFGLNEGHNDEAFSTQFGLVKMTYSWGRLMVSLQLFFATERLQLIVGTINQQLSCQRFYALIFTEQYENVKCHWCVSDEY